MIRATYICVLFFLIINSLYSQTPKFSQSYAIPLYLNPSFAGNTLQSRIITNYKNQWPSIPDAFVNYSFSYDHNLTKLNSGIGFMLVRDKSGNGGLRYTNVGGQYAYVISLSEKLYLRSGLHFSRSTIDVDISNLNINDQLVWGGSILPSNSYIEQKVGYWDFASGVLLYSNKFWVGITSRHLTHPDQSLNGDENLLPIKYDIHGGIKVPFSGYHPNEQFITPLLRYRIQEKNDQMDLGFFYTNKSVILGLWHRGIPVFKKHTEQIITNDAVILIGYTIKNFNIGYSYDIVFSPKSINAGGAHEISLVYEFASDKMKKKDKIQKHLVPCVKL